MAKPQPALEDWAMNVAETGKKVVEKNRVGNIVQNAWEQTKKDWNKESTLGKLIQSPVTFAKWAGKKISNSPLNFAEGSGRKAQIAVVTAGIGAIIGGLAVYKKFSKANQAPNAETLAAIEAQNSARHASISDLAESQEYARLKDVQASSIPQNVGQFTGKRIAELSNQSQGMQVGG